MFESELSEDNGSNLLNFELFNRGVEGFCGSDFWKYFLNLLGFIEQKTTNRRNFGEFC
jgi:hypothetical protein